MMTRHYLFAALLLTALSFATSSSIAEEQVDGVTSTYEWVEVADGYRLRAIITRPQGATGALPLVYFVQWLSCDSIEIAPRNDGWTQMLRGLVTGGDYLVARVDKAGVGDSEGPQCGELDYETELRDHRDALAHIAAMPGVDPDRVVIFGASMGATMAPLLARSHDVVGVAAWGGGGVSWFERLLAFDRNALELGGTDADEIARVIADNVAFYAEYLLEGQTPTEIITANPAMKQTVDNIIGLSESDHYGRPFSFHHQAQQQNWLAAWSDIQVPVFVAFGEYDWFETESAHRSIATIVNRHTPARARLVVIPKMDHHFSLFSSAEAAFEDTEGTPDARPFLDVFLPWINSAISR